MPGSPNAFAERVTRPAAGLGHEMTVEVHPDPDGLVAEPAGDLRDGHTLGQRGAGERVSRREKVVSAVRPAAAMAGFQMLRL
jgi:hypothetical protein